NMFRDNEIVVQPVLLDNQILISYIQNYLNGIVGDTYSNPYGQGRIQIKKVETVSETVNYWVSRAFGFAKEWGFLLGEQQANF
ncbi:MAG: hypothetical protein K0S04_2895, partial [Herbinix sp.]|nr:hypothetical protein [Herbinix sp.]